MRARLLILAVPALLCLTPACAPYHNIDQADCPCSAGWKCCPDGITCVPEGTDCPCEATEEVCDGLDNNCDGLTDEDCCEDLAGWYRITWDCPDTEIDVARLFIEQENCDWSFEAAGGCQGHVDRRGYLTLECLALQTGQCTGDLDEFEPQDYFLLGCESMCFFEIMPAGCEFAPNGTDCDDYNFCTMGDVCQQGECQGLTRPCHDQDPCTIDSCDRYHGRCVNQPKEECQPCHSSRDCTGGTTCLPEICHNGFCDTRTESSLTECDDGDPCTIDDHCSDGECIGTPVDCHKP